VTGASQTNPYSEALSKPEFGTQGGEIPDLRRRGRPGIAAMTIAFGIGQTLGPFAVGANSDAMRSLSYALSVSAATLALGAVLAAFQGKVAQK